ncbi:MAG: ribonuclease HI family protein [Cyanobacteria bacterium]|nr:ribonuclease HI family protein [Cyanobacteriota bacterium]MDA1021491.1 ribonuclease HI family protein [Cyanobacteriota bacterium]
MSIAVIYTDGASKGNPGESSIGVSILEGHQEVATISKAIGVATNNVAEYTALLEGLKKVKELGYRKVAVNADSELMIKQLKREYKVKNPDLKVIFLKLQDLIKDFDSVSFTHVRREFNTRADELANLAL